MHQKLLAARSNAKFQLQWNYKSIMPGKPRAPNLIEVKYTRLVRNVVGGIRESADIARRVGHLREDRG